MTNDSPDILIVGAGAQGLVVGYHLELAGARVTFLVRKGRCAALEAGQTLYCYNDGTLKRFDHYEVASEVQALAGRRFSFVLVTLDGASCRSAEGLALLTALGDLLRDSETYIIAGGVGVRGLFVQTMKLADMRVLEGTLGGLAYQTDRVTLPLHSPTDPKDLAASNIAYHHFSNRTGFMMSGRSKDAAARFAALHTRSGVSNGNVVRPIIFAIMSTAFFPITAMCDLAGWPDAATMAADKKLMRLGSAAMREIIALPQHGWMGQLIAPMVRRATLGMVLKKMEQDSLPLDFNAFNAFHHGGKVREQDIQVMKNCITSGSAAGRRMTAVRELVVRYERHINTSAITAIHTA